MNEMNNEVVYQAGGQDVKLSPGIVAQFVTKGNGEITMAEAVNFMNLCRYSGLNPFLNEAYLIKFGQQPAQMVVSKEAILKRASREPDFKGMSSGIITASKDGDINHRKGQLVYPGETLIGAWAEVHRDSYVEPVYAEVGFSEYNTGKSTWKKMPGNMINKVAQNKALREAYPDQLGALYTEEEPSVEDLKKPVKVEPEKEEVTQDLLDEFKQQQNKANESEEKEVLDVEPEVMEPMMQDTDQAPNENDAPDPEDDDEQKETNPIENLDMLSGDFEEVKSKPDFEKYTVSELKHEMHLKNTWLKPDLVELANKNYDQTSGKLLTFDDEGFEPI